jgi:predicted ATPase/DNA-binding CsgD family transcriptional regulator
VRDDRLSGSGRRHGGRAARAAQEGAVTPFPGQAPTRARSASPARARPARPPPGERHHNLPAQLTTFVGREREIAEIERLLPDVRLLTLTGAPGVGKTRLALRVAGGLLEDYPDGVWLAELASLADPTLVSQAVAAALRVRERPGRPLLATLADALRCRQLLLVLDNCEHLVEACAALADSLLRACPRLRILATSREPLGVAGEAVWRVPSLSLPDAASPADPEQPPSTPSARESTSESPTPAPVDDPTPYEALRLFAERARLVQPGFALTGQNVASVARACRHLDGVPLAIELAAARVNVLSPDQIASRLDDRFGLLTGGSRTAPPRHRTLRAATEWSYDLLGPAERALFNRLAIFTGGWTLEAAEAVGSGPWAVGSDNPGVEAGLEPVPTAHCPLPTAHSVLDLLSRLVDKSLVVAEAGSAGAIRYRMLETLREYGLERLSESGEAEAVRRRHAAFFLGLAEEAEPELWGPEQGRWAERLEREHDNLRAALGWAIDGREVETALRLGGALWKFWTVRGHLSEGQSRLDAVLAVAAAGRPAGTALARARVLNGAGNLARSRGDFARATALYEDGLARFREAGDTRGIAVSLHNLGLVARDRGDHAGARMRLEEGLALFRGLGEAGHVALGVLNLARLAQDRGDDRCAERLYEESLALFTEVGDTQGIATALNRLGDLARGRGESAAARALHERSLALHRERRDGWGIAISLTYLARLAHREGDHGRAAALAAESLALLRDLGLRPDLAATLEVMAAVSAARGQPDRAVRLFGAAARLREAIGAPLPPADRGAHERELGAARARLGEDAFAAAWAVGRAMTPEGAIEHALATEEPAPVASGASAKGSVGGQPGALTRRELEVTALIARGLTNRQIADELVIADLTADTHVRNIFGKLGFRSRAQVAAWAAEQGLLAPSP